MAFGLLKFDVYARDFITSKRKLLIYNEIVLYMSRKGFVA